MRIWAELNILIYLIIFQFKMLFFYWLSGLLAGSMISVFASEKIGKALANIRRDGFSLIAIILASLLGAASPVCMYGTVPLIASLGRKGVPQYLLAAFMVSSILINPNLFIFSFSLGSAIAVLRLLAAVFAGVAAGILVKMFLTGKSLFNLNGFEIKQKSARVASPIVRLLTDINRGIVKTAPYFFAGILLTALSDRYLPEEWIVSLFLSNKKLGVVLAASLGVPVYVCGGGTIPLIKTWMDSGMGAGAVLAFMITGPATKLTNLSAVKIILGIRYFIFYIVYISIFALIAGLLTDFIL